jgi:hypothetical protein
MGEMLPLGTKQSGGKIIPHSNLRGAVLLEWASRVSFSMYVYINDYVVLFVVRYGTEHLPSVRRISCEEFTVVVTDGEREGRF